MLRNTKYSRSTLALPVSMRAYTGSHWSSPCGWPSGASKLVGRSVARSMEPRLPGFRECQNATNDFSTCTDAESRVRRLRSRRQDCKNAESESH